MKKTFITKLLAFAVSSALSVSGAVSIAHHNSAINDAAEESVTASVIETYAAETSEVETMDETDGAVSVAAAVPPAEKTETAKTLVAETAVSTEEVTTTAAAAAVNTEKAATATVKTEEATEVAETTVKTEEATEVADEEVIVNEVMVASDAAPAAATASRPVIPENDKSSSGTISSDGFVTVTGSLTGSISSEGFVVTPRPKPEEPKTEEVEEPKTEEVEEPKTEEPKTEEPKTEEVEEPKTEVVEEPEIQVTHYSCNCGYGTDDYEALKWHMLDHALKGEKYSYSAHVGNIQ